MERATSFGYWLRRRRKALDLTQEGLARQVGCAVGTIKKLEGDERRPSRQFAERLADLLAIPPQERPAFLKAARAELAADELEVAAQPIESPLVVEPSAGPLPAGTVTFLFTDIEDSTKLWTQHPDWMCAALARHDALLRAAIGRHNGAVFKTVGDAFHAAFVSVTHALAAALTAQHALQAESWGELTSDDAQPTLMVRMALHSGTAEVRDGDYFGHTLNRIARLLTAGHGGQILLSAATCELLRDHLPPGVALRDLGPYWLKSLPRPEQIYQLVAPDLPADFPPLHTLDRPTTNLPAQATAFIGREKEVAEVRELLRRADVRLVTLTGPGGTGKTRFGLQVATELLNDESSPLLSPPPTRVQQRERPALRLRSERVEGERLFPDGIWFVNLAPLNDPGLVAATVAQTFGLREVGGQPIQEVLKSYLRAKQLLLLLDNFEQIADAAPLIGELLAAAPGLTLLITSRMPLHLSGEREYGVPPLGLPPTTNRQRPNLQTISQYEAVRLFIERAQAIKADFTVTNENALAVVEICARLDGLPLAIELAATRIKLFPPRALLGRLGSRLKLLTGGAHDLSARQQTIRNTIDWSYQLLGGDQQRLFARLGVFVGGCTLEAAEAVCNADADLPMEIMDGIATLLDQSLLQQKEGIDGEPRFLMLETIREYSLERLEQSGEAEALRRLHAGYYRTLAQAAVSELRGVEQLAWIERIEAEHDNLRAALAWSQTRREGAEIGLQLTGALGWFWYMLGYWTEGRAWLADVLTGTVEADRSSARAQALNSAGLLTYCLGDYAAAQRILEESVILWRELGDQQGLAYALQYLANVPGSLGDYALCRILLEESVALFRAVADDWGLTQSLSYLGNLTQAQGDDTSARRLLEESLALSRPQGYTWNSAVSLRILGSIALAQGDYAVARATFEESLALCWATRDKSEAALAQLGLARVMWYQGAYEQAHVAYEDGLALCRELGDKEITALLLNGRGEMAWSTRDYTQAAAWYDQGLSLERELGNKARIANRLRNLGHVMLHQGDVPRAIKSFMESLTLQQERGDIRGIVHVLAGLGGLAGARGQPERATRLLGASTALCEHFDVHLERVDQFEFDGNLAAVRAQLDEATFAAAWEAGRALTLEQAIAEALGGAI